MRDMRTVPNASAAAPGERLPRLVSAIASHRACGAEPTPAGVEGSLAGSWRILRAYPSIGAYFSIIVNAGQIAGPLLSSSSSPIMRVVFAMAARFSPSVLPSW